MKNYHFVLAAFLILFSVNSSISQFIPSYNLDGKRTITTEGKVMVNAEIDQIEVRVVLSDEFCAGPKQNMNTLTETFEKNLKSVGYAASDAKLISEDTQDLGYTNANNSTVMIIRTYEITFQAARHYFTFQKLMPSSGMVMEIMNIKSSKIDQVKKDGLNLAFDDAKAKAESLLQKAGGTLGPFLNIIHHEPYEWNGSAYSTSDISSYEMEMIKGIEIECTVQVMFEVK